MGLFKKLFGSSSDDDSVRRVRMEVFRKMAEAEEQAQGDTPDASLLYDVVLIDGRQRIYKASRIIEKYKGIRYTEASAMVENSPCVVAERVTYDEAASLCEEFKNALAEAFIRRSEGQTEKSEVEMDEEVTSNSDATLSEVIVEDNESNVSKESVTIADEKMQSEQETTKEQQKKICLMQLVTDLAASKMQNSALESECEAKDNQDAVQKVAQKETPEVEVAQKADIEGVTSDENEDVLTDALEENVLDRGCWIASYNDECITIPEEYTGIGQCCFAMQYRSLKKVLIPNTITSIGQLAFCECSSLEEILIPDSVKTIGDGAFRDCSSLKSIKLSAYLESIGKNAFAGCSSLKEIVIPDSVQLIDDNAFENCLSLEEVRLSAQLTSIGGSAFCDCSSLEEISLPDSVITIGDYVFSRCEALEKVRLSKHLTSVGNGAFDSCNALEEIKIPHSVTSIGEGAFRFCENLENIIIADSVTTIGNNAFSFCENLETLKMPVALEKIGEDACNAKLKCLDFSKCSILTKLNLKMLGTSQIKCLYMPSHLEKLKGESWARITTLYLPPSFKKMPEAALLNCEQIYCYSEEVESTFALVSCCKQLFVLPGYIESFVAYLQAEGKSVEQVGDRYKVDVSGVTHRHIPTVITPIPAEQLYLYDD